MNRWDFPDLGVGLSVDERLLRRALDEAPEIGLFEVITEEFLEAGEESLAWLDALSMLFPVVLHGTCLSLGSDEELDFEYLEQLEALADRIRAPWISDHLCWSGVRERQVPAQAPMEYTEERLRHLTSRVRRVQDFLERPLALENPGARAHASRAGIPEQVFLARLAEAADSPLVLDLESLCRNARRQGTDPAAYLAALPRERIVELHIGRPPRLASAEPELGDCKVREQAWSLFAGLVREHGPITTVVECHSERPEFQELHEGARYAAALLEKESHHALSLG